MLRKILRLLGIAASADGGQSFAQKLMFPGRNMKRDLDLEALLIEVAQEFEDIDKFREVARVVASKMKFSRAKHLTRYFHQNPPEPEALKSKIRKYGLLGVWMNICQNAIFEILYNYKAQAIPTLYSIGFGEYDWTQYKAIDVLCRFAKEGIQTEEIIKSIGDKIQHFRYEAVFPSLASLSDIPDNKEVANIILNFFAEYSKDDPIEGLHILRLLAVNYPDEVKNKLSFVKSIAQGSGIENRSPILDGAVLSIDDEGNETYSIRGEIIDWTFEEPYKINAALLYFFFDNTDNEINHLIDFWEDHAKEKKHRKMITDMRNRV